MPEKSAKHGKKDNPEAFSEDGHLTGEKNPPSQEGRSDTKDVSGQNDDVDKENELNQKVNKPHQEKPGKIIDGEILEAKEDQDDVAFKFTSGSTHIPFEKKRRASSEKEAAKKRSLKSSFSLVFLSSFLSLILFAMIMIVIWFFGPVLGLPIGVGSDQAALSQEGQVALSQQLDVANQQITDMNRRMRLLENANRLLQQKQDELSQALSQSVLGSEATANEADQRVYDQLRQDIATLKNQYSLLETEPDKAELDALILENFEQRLLNNQTSQQEDAQKLTQLYAVLSNRLQALEEGQLLASPSGRFYQKLLYLKNSLKKGILPQKDLNNLKNEISDFSPSMQQFLTPAIDNFLFLSGARPLLAYEQFLKDYQDLMYQRLKRQNQGRFSFFTDLFSVRDLSRQDQSLDGLFNQIETALKQGHLALALELSLSLPEEDQKAFLKWRADLQHYVSLQAGLDHLITRVERGAS